MGVNDKVRTDLDLHKGFNLGMEVYAIERSYPKVGVSQVWKQYLKKLKNYMHTFWKLKHCANAEADAHANRCQCQWLGDNISSPMPMTGWQHKLSRDIVRRAKIEFIHSRYSIMFSHVTQLSKLKFTDTHWIKSVSNMASISCNTSDPASSHGSINVLILYCGKAFHSAWTTWRSSATFHGGWGQALILCPCWSH